MGEREEEGRERKERAGGSRRHGGGGKGRRKLHEKRDLTGRGKLEKKGEREEAIKTGRHPGKRCGSQVTVCRAVGEEKLG